MQVNGRSIEVQMRRNFLAARFVWDAKFPTEFQDTFMPFFIQERNDAVESLTVINAIALFNSTCCLNLRDFQWSDLALHLLVFQTHLSVLHWILMSLECFLTAAKHCTRKKKWNSLFCPVLPGSIQTSCLELRSLVQRWTVEI